jgi:hypothetical protein
MPEREETNLLHEHPGRAILEFSGSSSLGAIEAAILARFDPMFSFDQHAGPLAHRRVNDPRLRPSAFAKH